MELVYLQQHIRMLACLEETPDPVVSCYLDLTGDPATYRSAFEHRVRTLRMALSEDERARCEESLAKIKRLIDGGFENGTQGAAIFSRSGTHPLFLPLQFRVPVPNWISLDSTPNIYHLVELKDTYHRFIVLMSTETQARILEVNLGAVTSELLIERPELRRRVGREWTKEHYQNHRHERGNQFVKQKIRILEKLVSAEGYSHLILAGNPQMIARVQNELPKHLAQKVVDAVAPGSRNGVPEVVRAALASFVEEEERESRAVVQVLQRQLRTGGLAVAGARQTLEALVKGQVDVLLIAKDYESDPGWRCGTCGAVVTQYDPPRSCGACRSTDLREIDAKAEMVRLAEQFQGTVEVVTGVNRFGGVGALLRYRN